MYFRGRLCLSEERQSWHLCCVEPTPPPFPSSLALLIHLFLLLPFPLLSDTNRVHFLLLTPPSLINYRGKGKKNRDNGRIPTFLKQKWPNAFLGCVPTF